VYSGLNNPNDVEEYLEKYKDEVELLQNEGICFDEHEHVYPVEINSYILDAPARSFVKTIIGHGGDRACEKCEVKGVRYMSREVFCDFNARLRTGESFRNRRDPHHHTGTSPLEKIGTGMIMISPFRLDPLHLVLLGVFLRYLVFLFGKGKMRGLLKESEKNEIRSILNAIAQYVPFFDFNRRPKSFKFFFFFLQI